jgi:hypothetical protein
MTTATTTYYSKNVPGCNNLFAIFDEQDKVIAEVITDDVNQLIAHLSSDDTGYNGKGGFSCDFEIFNPSKQKIATVSNMITAKVLLSHLNKEIN